MHHPADQLLDFVRIGRSFCLVFAVLVFPADSSIRLSPCNKRRHFGRNPRACHPE
jgi:hypothetical protein